MKLRSGYETKKTRIEMLPLIDVVFLLLVFFIYAMLSMVVRHGMKVELPRSGTTVQERNQTITLTISAENALFLDGKPIDLKEVAAAVLAQNKPVFIQGDRTADLGFALELLDLLKEAGIKEVSFSCTPKTP